jgi:hypothetical protein
LRLMSTKKALRHGLKPNPESDILLLWLTTGTRTDNAPSIGPGPFFPLIDRTGSVKRPLGP